MLSPEVLFDLYRAGERDALLVGFLPRLKSWSKQILNSGTRDLTADWLIEVAHAGIPRLVELLTRQADRQFESGIHFVCWVRKHVKKTMLEAWLDLAQPVRPTSECIRKRRLRGEPDYRPYDPVNAVPLDMCMIEQEVSCSARTKPLPDEMYHWDELDKTNWHEFAFKFGQLILARSKELGWTFIGEGRADGHSFPSGEIRNLSSKIVKERLAYLGRYVARTAPPDVDELGREFYGRLWTSAAAANRYRNKNWSYSSGN